MKHFASSSFWACYNQLPAIIRELADQCFEVLKSNLRHPSLHFKKIQRYHSVRVGLHHRALAIEVPDGLVWFWIGTHDEYQRIIKRTD